MVKTNDLKAEIVRNGFTIAKLAHRVGMTKSTLSRKIRNLSPLTITEATSIAHALGKTIEEFSIFFDDKLL